MDHNKIIPAEITSDEVDTPIFVLLNIGMLVGPFNNRHEANKWCNDRNLPGFSTYDVISPGDFLDGKSY